MYGNLNGTDSSGLSIYSEIFHKRRHDRRSKRLIGGSLNMRQRLKQGIAFLCAVGLLGGAAQANTLIDYDTDTRTLQIKGDFSLFNQPRWRDCYDRPDNK